MKKWQLALVTVLIIVIFFLMDGGQVYIKQLINRPPKAAFSYRTPTRTLKYIAPTDRDLIIFSNNSTDTDGDRLTSQWYVRFNATGDWKLLNSSRDHWGRLPVSNEKGHEIKLVVSDGMKEDSVSVFLPVDAASRYSARQLGIKTKGINFQVGYQNWWQEPLSDQEMSESLEVIRKELGCNAVRIYGDFEEPLMKCGKMAVDKGFSLVLLSPRYRRMPSGQDVDIAVHIERIIGFSKKAELLRQESNLSEIVLVVGNELTVDTIGIYDGRTYADRVKQKSQNWRSTAYNEKLNSYLQQIVIGVKTNFHGRTTYAKGGGGDKGGGWENVKWADLDFDIVSSNEYIASEWWTESEQLRAIRDLKLYGKLLFITEFGSVSYEGAGVYGGGGWSRYTAQNYSQEEQVGYVMNSIPLYRSAATDAVFYYTFLERLDEDARSYGILRYSRDALNRRKLGFYAYQSFIAS